MVQEGIQEHIKWLEAQLEAKRKEANSSLESENEREKIKEIIRDIAAPAPIVSLSTPSDDASTYTLAEKEHEQIIQELVKIAITKNLGAAMRLARALKNPHLEDEFHDTLADHFYEKLQEARKIKM